MITIRFAQITAYFSNRTRYIASLQKPIAAILLVFLMFGAGASAQDEAPEATPEITEEPTITLTPTPTLTPIPEPTTIFEGESEGFVFKWSADSIFPEGIRFFIALQRPVEQIERLTLTIRLVGGTAVTVDVPFDEPVAQGEDFADIQYLWEFSADQFARFLEGVEYEWLAVDSAGEQARVQDGLVFSDERTLWTTQVDPQGQIDLTLPLGGLSASAVRGSVLDVYGLLAANTGRTQPLNVVLYDADLPGSGCVPAEDESLIAISPVSQVSLPCDPTSAATLLQASGYDLVQSDGTNVSSAQSALIAYLVPKFYEPTWQDVPQWFVYGLTQFYHPASKQPFFGPVRNAARLNSLLSWGVMENPESAPAELWRAQSYAMVLNIADSIGISGLYMLANDLDNAASFAEAYRNAVGQPLDTLIPAVQRWIFTNEAVGAFNLTAYQSVTATPTATPTATATRTPTAPPSATVEPSETPTNTPTRTRVPPTLTPTVTPRAASSLFTATPTPVPSPLAVLSDPGVQSGILSILLIALVIVVLLYFIQRRREDRW